MSFKNRLQPVPLTSVDVSTLTDISYTVVNGDGLPFPCSLMRISNNSGVDILISFDGINDHEFVFNDQVVALNAQTNAAPTNFVSLFPKGQKVYAKVYTGTGTGALIVSAYGLLSE